MDNPFWRHRLCVGNSDNPQFFVDNFGSWVTLPGNVRQGRFHDEAGIACLNLYLRVDEQNFLQLCLKRSFELPGLRVVAAELHRQSRPRDYCGALQVANPVGKPCVDVQSHGGLFKGFDGSHIDWNGPIHHLIEKML